VKHLEGKYLAIQSQEKRLHDFVENQHSYYHRREIKGFRVSGLGQWWRVTIVGLRALPWP
jgi:hypothetical protein